LNVDSAGTAYSKSDILETYLNEVYPRPGGCNASINGFGLASPVLFFRGLRLLPHQLSAIDWYGQGAQLLQPSSATRNVPRPRRNLVLDKCSRWGLWVKPTRSSARSFAPLGVSETKRLFPQNRYPAYIDLVRRHLARDYKEEDLRSEGLRVFTNLLTPLCSGGC